MMLVEISSVLMVEGREKEEQETDVVGDQSETRKTHLCLDENELQIDSRVFRSYLTG